MSDDDALRRKVARLWSELNHAEITPEMIHCTGCRRPGAKTPFSDSLCPIRQCARGRNLMTCGGCSEMECCAKLRMITGNHPEALRNLNGKN